jgi:hypothetical protein
MLSRSSSPFEFAIHLAIIFGFSVNAKCATFPLPTPKRAETFPLTRPRQTGTIVAWGQLEISPPALKHVVSIAVGGFDLALIADGTVVAWGPKSYVPVGLSNVVQIAAANDDYSGDFCLALTSDGRIIQWGILHSPIWVPIPEREMVAVAAINTDSYNSEYAMALRKDGTVVSWVLSSGGKFEFSEASAVIGVHDVVAIAGGLAVRANGAVLFGPAYLSNNIVAVSTGYTTGLALRNDGSVTAWGRLSRSGASVSVTDSNVVAVAAAPEHLVTLHSDGTVSVFYGTDYGQNRVPGYTNFIGIAAGGLHVLGLLSDGPSRPARATAQIVDGFLVGIDLIDGGKDYYEPPAIRIVGGAGSGATAVAQIFDGAVTGFTITSAGFGYSTDAEVRIASPPFDPSVSAFGIGLLNLTLDVTPGDSYQLESSTNLTNWDSVGSPFAANSSSYNQGVQVPDAAQFFRLRRIP